MKKLLNMLLSSLVGTSALALTACSEVYAPSYAAAPAPGYGWIGPAYYGGVYYS